MAHCAFKGFVIMKGYVNISHPRPHYQMPYQVKHNVSYDRHIVPRSSRVNTVLIFSGGSSIV